VEARADTLRGAGLLRLATLVAGSRDVGEEIMQEAFVRAATALPRLSDEETGPYLEPLLSTCGGTGFVGSRLSVASGCRGSRRLRTNDRLRTEMRSGARCGDFLHGSVHAWYSGTTRTFPSARRRSCSGVRLGR